MPVSLVPDRLPVRRCRSAALGARDDVGEEPRCAGRIRSGHDRTLSYRGMSIQCSLDLARLNAVTADLHLMVETSQIRKRAIGQPLPEIAGPVEARFRTAKGIGDKALQGQLRSLQIASGHAGAPNQDFTGYADRQ